MTARPVGGKVHPADFRRQCRASPLRRAPGNTPPASPLSWESNWSRRRRRERSRRPHVVPRRLLASGSEWLCPAGWDQAQALGTCPAPCPQATRDTRLGLEAHGPGCGSWSGAEAPERCDKRNRCVLVTGSVPEAPRPRNCPPPGKGQRQERLRFVSEVRATFVGALTKEPKDPRLPSSPAFRRRPSPAFTPLPERGREPE